MTFWIHDQLSCESCEVGVVIWIEQAKKIREASLVFNNTGDYLNVKVT